MNDKEIDEVWEYATRIGTFALLVFAVTSFVSSIFLPFMIASPEDNIDQKKREMEKRKKTRKKKTGIEQGHTGIDVDDGGDCSSDDDDDDDDDDDNGENSLRINNKHDERSNGPRSITSMITYQVSKLVIPGLSLRRAWLLSHILFAVTMLCTFFVRSPVAGTVLVGIVGISWALTLWAPFALISAEISQRDVRRRRRQRSHKEELLRRRGRQSSATEGLGRQGQGQRPRPKRRSTTLSQHSIILPVSPLSNITNNNNVDDDDEDDDRAGIILGLHNVSISAPQIIATLGSSVVFRLLQRPRGAAGDDSVGWVLRIAALSALVAAWLTSHVKDEDGDNNDDDDDDEGNESEGREPGRSSPLTV